MCRVKIAIRTIGDYIKQWGFTTQKPIKKAYEQSPKAVQEWLDNSYPEIKKLAKTEDAEIYWVMRQESEMIVSIAEDMHHAAKRQSSRSMQRDSR